MHRLRRRNFYRRKLSIRWDVLLTVLVMFTIITITFFGIKAIIYKNTFEYKLLKKGYNNADINFIIKNFDNTEIEAILNFDKNENIIALKSDPYFIFDNLSIYLNYLKINNSASETVKLVNTNAYKKFYESPIKSDISKNELIIVNKFNYLESDFTPDNLIDASLKYSYNGNKLSKVAYDNFVSMWNAAKMESMNLILASSYRDYNTQEDIYNSAKNTRGITYADGYIARPGYSEHQTGLALDILSTSSNINNFEATKEFAWLKDNSYKYGFILRYPKEKEYLTGFNYEPWHYRYVGVKAAKIIYDENITFDEYYAFFEK